MEAACNVGAVLRNPIFFHSCRLSFFLSFFLSCSEDASQPRSGTSTARTRSANPEEYLEGGLSGSPGTEKEGGGGEGKRRRCAVACSTSS